MEKQNIYNYQFILGIFLLLIGAILYFAISGSMRFIGIFFIVFAIVIFSLLMLSKSNISNSEKFKSKTRDQILRHQYKK